MSNRPQNPNYQPDDNNDDRYPPRQNSYPPQGNYPPQEGNINLDDPRFGGGAPAPRPNQQQYPPPQQPSQGSYPPPNSQQGSSQGGNINLDDPRFGGHGNQNAPPSSPPPQQQYPPPQSYPPPGGQQSAPQGGNINLDNPRFGSSGAPNAPAQRQGGYAPPDRPANQGPSGNQSFGGPINLDDPRFGGGGSGGSNAQLGGSSGGGRSNITLDDPPMRGRDDRDEDAPRRPKTKNREGGPRGIGLSEGQVEALANGSVVILLGVSLIQAVTGSSEFLRILFPMLAGGILLTSAVYQRFVMKWHVSIWTWFLALLLVSYTITLFVAGDDAGPFRWITYFTGTLIIMAGIVRTLQVFRASDGSSS
jgi:hypothetical protein